LTKKEWQIEIESLTPAQKKELAYGILLLSIEPLYEKHSKQKKFSYELEKFWFAWWG